MTAIDLQGYKAVISYGFTTSAGAEYSDSNYLYVLEQTFSSAPGSLTCDLICVGQRDQMAEDRADAAYTPTTDTTQALISAILGSTLAPYDDLPAYTLSYDTTDTLLTTFTPAQSFRVLVNTTRQAALSRLLNYTTCVARPEDDGKIHVFVPTTTGTTYNYEYALTGSHTFYNKSKRKRIVIPNHIKVTDYETPVVYSGEASHAASIAAYREVYQYEKFYTLASNAQAASLAAAILARYEMNSETAAAEVPMNVGAEIYDYVKITDAREDDTAIGNIGYIHRRFSAIPSSQYPHGRYRMTIGFGGWLNSRRLLTEIDADTNPSDRTLDSLQVKYIRAEQIDFENFTGEWYDLSGISINAGSGINIYGKANALTTRATKTGTIQCYVGADGAIYAGAGKVILDSTGLIIGTTGASTAHLIIKDSAGTIQGTIIGSTTLGLNIINLNGEVYIGSAGTLHLSPDSPYGVNVWADFMNLPMVSSDPSSPSEGDTWYNTTTHVWKCYNGTAVKTLTWS